MLAIILAVLLVFCLQLAVWECVVLGISYGVHLLSGADVPYGLIALIVFGVWFVILLIYGLFTYGAYRLERGE
ncbi:hypothetical protein MOE50_04955 [Bacillus inaquosorum]|uniref:hypothetical protein n=1 Tax=Bacillus inaquosorum TaxID=483913 RepID=UPI00227FB990|nr:hypothetical protein [Bacillus inaquosorum]MCY9008350.1 hypothetical protein [Bacillus inaquosorum]MCY9038586.1 hypothetical protein [Bacillus inaquosorum]MCY9043834.1 hypothetical protein [Bacillus inaquosorum]